jgi:LacI family transcriptional regulator
MDQKPRIKDIAKMAGVSEGTVDRVLHNRGEVSAKSKEAVLKVLDEINYSPNLIARSLATKKHFNFICMIPDYQQGDYWQQVEKAFHKAGRDFLQYNIHLDIQYFNQFDIRSFQDLTNKIGNMSPSAVILAPIFHDESLDFCEKLTRNDIPFSFIDSVIEEAGFTSYYGQNSTQSGYLAAKLLLNGLAPESKILVLRTKRKGSISNQTNFRFEGFMNYYTRHAPQSMELVLIEITDEDDKKNKEAIQQIFEKKPGINAAIVFNSKAYKLANYLTQLNKTSIRMIGYDLLQKNIEHLKNDVISCLIAQSPGKQAYFTIRDLCAKLILKQEIKKINYVPIDIVIKENIDDYLEFREKY